MFSNCVTAYASMHLASGVGLILLLQQGEVDKFPAAKSMGGRIGADVTYL